MDLRDLWYGLPLLPFVFRAVVHVRFRSIMRNAIEKEEADRGTNRTVLAMLVGVGLTLAIGLITLGETVEVDLSLTIFYAIISVLASLAGFVMQGVKSARWEENVSDALREVSVIAIIACIVGLVLLSNGGPEFKVPVAALGTAAIAFDLYKQLRNTWSYLTGLEELQA